MLLRSLGIVLPALLLGCQAGCERTSTEPDRPAANFQPDTASGRNTGTPTTDALLITLDTTRADHLGCYGYPSAETPHLDALAAAGTRFEAAYAQVPLTTPSHATLLTATYPVTHGIRVNGVQTLPDNLPTLAGSLRAAGYQTAAFVAAFPLDHRFGLNRGFDHYDDNFAAAPSSAGGDDARRPANAVVDAATAWLRGQGDQAVFLWVHFFDPHAPYAPPEPFRAKHDSAYDGEIAFMDAEIGRLLAAFDGRTSGRSKLVFVVGDHGEGLGEHGESQHGLFLYGSTTRVPMLVRFAGTVPAGETVTTPAGIVDVAPTILDLLDLPRLAKASGQSVRPTWQSAATRSTPVYMESQYARLSFGWASQYGLVTDEWTFIDAPRPELFDRARDPAQQHNLATDKPDVVTTLRKTLAAIVDDAPNAESGRLALDDEARQRLGALGYIGAEPPQESAGDERSPYQQPAGQDPKDMIDVLEGLMRGKNLVQEEKYGEAIALLEPLAARSPESDSIQRTLGAAYLSAGQYANAEKAYRHSLRTFPDDAGRLCPLGDTYFYRREYDQAIECYQKALRQRPDYAQVHSRLGFIYADQKKYEQAERHMRRYVDLAPDSPNALCNLAGLYLETNRPKPAAPLLKHALKIDKACKPAHRMLWIALTRSHQPDDAIAALRDARDYIPDDLQMNFNLSRLLATSADPSAHDLSEAARLAERCAQAKPGDASVLDLLGMVAAAQGDFQTAMQHANAALAIAKRKPPLNRLAEEIQNRLAGYAQGQRHVKK